MIYNEYPNLPPSPFFDKTGVKRIYLKNILYWVVNWSAVLGIILAGSRTVWLLMVVMLVIEQYLKFKPNLASLGKKERKKYLNKIAGRILLFGGITMMVLGVININYRISDFVGGWDKESIYKREMLALSALKMIKSSFMFGKGTGNFLVNLPKFQKGGFYWMQPVHNIFLLSWSEIGFLGIIIFLTKWQLLVSNLKLKKYWWIWVIVGITGMVDHYWLTLPQNTWLLAIILGVM